MVPPDEHKSLVKNAYAVIIPSISEMSPNNAVDAIYYGKPFIMTSDTGAQERLGNVGIFIDTLNPEALKDAIKKLLDTEEYARACARVQKFDFVHSWEEIIKEFTVALKSLCVS